MDFGSFSPLFPTFPPGPTDFSPWTFDAIFIRPTPNERIPEKVPIFTPRKREPDMRKIFSLLFCAVSILPGWAQRESYFANPVIHGDVADPSIIRIGQTYYATGTSSEWAPHYPIFASTDLVNWKQTGHVLTDRPEWAKSSFWAPEWFYHKGKVYVYYTARKRSDNISCIGVAVADSPNGKFEDYGPVVEFGKEAIDAALLEDDGKLYISWKAYGLDDRPIELLACQLTDDGLRLKGKPFTLLRDENRQGMEGQYWFKKEGYYYILYAIRGCCGPRSDYAVSVARSKKLEGPYENYSMNPILHGGKEILSIGHGTLTTTPDGRMYYLCHAYLPESGFFQGRQPFLQEIRMGEDHWPHFVTGEYASLTQPMPFVESAQSPVPDFFDDFSDTSVRPEWSWNFPFSAAEIHIREGKLALSGTPHPDVHTGTALCLRPTSSDYALETVVLNRNDSWKGIVMYGDAENLLSLGSAGDKLLLKSVLEGKEYKLAEMPLPASPIYLRMKVAEGTHCVFSWSEDGKRWRDIVGESISKADALLQWDRVSRPGLYQEGEIAAPAIFGYCSLKNK